MRLPQATTNQLALWREPAEPAQPPCQVFQHRRTKEDREMRCKAIEDLLRRAGDRGSTTAEIARRLGFSRSLVHVRLLGDLRKKVHIADFLSRGTGKPAARWVWGAGEDAPTPGLDADAVIDAQAAQERQQELEFKPSRQGLMAAFFGDR